MKHTPKRARNIELTARFGLYPYNVNSTGHCAETSSQVRLDMVAVSVSVRSSLLKTAEIDAAVSDNLDDCQWR